MAHQLQPRLSRRQMLRLTTMATGIAAVGSLLAACGQGSTPTTTTSTASAGGVPATTTTAPAAASGVSAPTPTPFPQQNFGSSNAKVAIRYWTILGNVDGIIMNDLVRKFSEQNPDIKVESLQGVTGFIQKMQSSAISGTAPDVALVRHTYIGPFVDKNIVTPLEPSDLAAANVKAEDYEPTVWKFTQYKGKQYTIPLDIHCLAMYFNKKLFTDAGIQTPTTLDEWTAAAAKLTQGDTYGYVTSSLGAGAVEGLSWYWYAYQRQFGGEMLTQDFQKAAFNTPAGIAALNWMKEINSKGNPQNILTTAATDLERTGKIASWAAGPWVITLFFDKDKAPAAPDLEVMPLPQHDPAKKAVWAQSHQFALPKQGTPDPARRAAAMKFIDWMTTHSIDWAKAGQLPARNSARAEALSSADPFLQKLKPFAEQLPYANFMPTSPKLLEVMPRIAANVEAAILGQGSVEDNIKKAEDEVNQILSQP